MVYIGLAMILAIIYLVEWLEDRENKKHTAIIEKTHEQIYELIDEHYSGREARERMASVDAMIGAYQKDNGRDYKPASLKQVTTVEERKARVKAELDGTATSDELIKAKLLDALDNGFSYPALDDDDWIYQEHTSEEKREHLIQSIINDGYSREEAERSADNYLMFFKEN